MNGRKIRAAINFALSIAETPLDELQIAIATFDDEVNRWPGTRDVNESGEVVSREGWSLMPSKDNLDLAAQWLSTQADGGSTYVTPGIRHCILSCSGIPDSTGPTVAPGVTQPVEQLTILLLTDGRFSDKLERKKDNDGPGILETLEALQQERIDAGLRPAALGAIGIDANRDDAITALTRLANTSCLGFLQVSFIKNGEDGR
jgi:hypothetical protein